MYMRGYPSQDELAFSPVCRFRNEWALKTWKKPAEELLKYEATWQRLRGHTINVLPLFRLWFPD